MQATDSKELPERARYYQGSIDVDCLKSYDFENGKEAGIEIGKEAKIIEAVLGLNENNIPIEVIAKSLKLTEEKVKEIISQKVPVKA